MSVADRKSRERAERERRITGAARRIAGDDGWSAVTIRRLADEIEYSQPVIYSHFRSRDAIVDAVAVEGFGELAAVLRGAAESSAESAADLREVLARAAAAYVDFAFDQPAMYDAMFVLSSGLRFAHADTPAQLRDAFDALAQVVAPFCEDADTATETLWAALHGAAQLERHGRIRPGARAQRLELIVRALAASGGQPGGNR